MKSHGQLAARVRAAKTASPRKYCANPMCMFRVAKADGSTAVCPKHPRANAQREQIERAEVSK